MIQDDEIPHCGKHRENAGVNQSKDTRRRPQPVRDSLWHEALGVVTEHRQLQTNSAL